ncbi:hypothetical protein TNCT_366751 [Trichonephila clavata]|uniref:Uncharacterized protein n=1 Tax=Trichonephila clavata TaxID=2740835 RepID=A0A8X6FP29_TRICU|nr:hypothetical protein TNCT_366751 [Trichonephila clavata]
MVSPEFCIESFHSPANIVHHEKKFHQPNAMTMWKGRVWIVTSASDCKFGWPRTLFQIPPQHDVRLALAERMLS